MIARCLFAIGCCLLLVGCGSRGPTTYRVQGAVTFDGKQVPGGRIDFFPDFNRGNSAMAGFASIKDGRYDTSAGGIGSAGGPMIVTVAGSLPRATDGDAKPTVETVFEYTFTTDLPSAVFALDVAVPASAGRTVQLSGPSPLCRWPPLANATANSSSRRGLRTPEERTFRITVSLETGQERVEKHQRSRNS